MLPAIHFALAGGALFFALNGLPGTGPAADGGPDGVARSGAGISREIVIDEARLRGLHRSYALGNGVIPTEAELRALAESAVTEEILLREALSRGLEQGDRAIAWRLVQKMRFLGEDEDRGNRDLYTEALEMGLHRGDPVVRRILVEKLRLLIGRAGDRPTDEELAAWYANNPQDYVQPARVTLRHLYFDRSKRGADAARAAAVEAATAASDAAATREQGEAPSPGKTADRGDPFPTGSRIVAQSGHDLRKLFGHAFAEAVLAQNEETWKGPVESSYGWHVVFVEERIAERLPPLSEVRSRATNAFEAERRAQRIRAFVAEVRPRYSVRIDDEGLRKVVATTLEGFGG